MGETTFEIQQVHVSGLPMNLEPCSSTSFSFAVSAGTQFMPPKNQQARMRFRTARGYTRCTLKFDQTQYMAPDAFLASYGLVIALSTEP